MYVLIRISRYCCHFRYFSNSFICIFMKFIQTLCYIDKVLNYYSSIAPFFPAGYDSFIF